MTNTKRLRRLVLAGIVICVAMLLFTGVAISSAIRDKHRAHAQCKYLAEAMETSFQSLLTMWRRTIFRSASPPTLNDLLTTGGEPRYLRRGAADLYDPWGKPYQLQIRERPDGTVAILVTTTAPDGTPINQHGIGPDAVPKP